MRFEDSVRVRHMIEAAEAALNFVHDRTRTDLDEDQMLQFALVRAIEIVGGPASAARAAGTAQVLSRAGVALVLFAQHSVLPLLPSRRRLFTIAPS